MSPLLALVLAVAVLYVVLDLVEHGGEVVNGIMKAGEPLPTLPVRSMSQAVVDLGIYYGIRGLGMVFDLMPVLLLIAGVFAVWAMVRNNEHLIFKSSGTPLQRAFLPIVLLAVGLSLVISALREFVMPRLVMERDRLKPLVYHRSPRPKSLAGVAMDEQGRLVVYEIARYVNNALTCEGVRIYLPGESAGGRLPRLEADRAVWDPAHSRWDLKTAVRRPGEGKDGEAIYADYGLLFVPQTVKGDPLDDRARFLMQKAPHWAGQLTPGFLESQDLGPSVMRLGELLAASDRPAYRSELWRRGFEWLTGLLLLMVALPLIVRLEVTSLLLGIGWCIVCGAVYVGLILATTEAAREEVAPAWFPVLPHAVFLVLGVWRYAFRTET
jgi:lipopolysaccharide export LptBFGC system permease protein LptF